MVEKLDHKSATLFPFPKSSSLNANPNWLIEPHNPFSQLDTIAHDKRTATFSTFSTSIARHPNLNTQFPHERIQHYFRSNFRDGEAAPQLNDKYQTNCCPINAIRHPELVTKRNLWTFGTCLYAPQQNRIPVFQLHPFQLLVTTTQKKTPTN